MDRKQLKAQSKNLIRTAQPKPVVTAIIYLLIISVLGFLSYKLVGGSSFELQSVYEQFGVIGFGVLVQFFVLPYMDLTYAGYYVELTKPKADAGFADGWTPEL